MTSLSEPSERNIGAVSAHFRELLGKGRLAGYEEAALAELLKDQEAIKELYSLFAGLTQNSRERRTAR